MKQRTLKIGDRVIYCYEDGSVEFLSSAKSHAKHPLVRTFGSKHGNGYRHIRLKLNGKKQYLDVHRLIATAFCPNPGSLPQVDHINRNRADNQPSNLRWVNCKTNLDNQASVDRSIAKYGVRKCENKKKYNELYNKCYRTYHVCLYAKQPNGKNTQYCFSSASDPAYITLKPLSMIERYHKYKELKQSKQY